MYRSSWWEDRNRPEATTLRAWKYRRQWSHSKQKITSPRREAESCQGTHLKYDSVVTAPGTGAVFQDRVRRSTVVKRRKKLLWKLIIHVIRHERVKNSSFSGGTCRGSGNMLFPGLANWTLAPRLFARGAQINTFVFFWSSFPRSETQTAKCTCGCQQTGPKHANTLVPNLQDTATTCGLTIKKTRLRQKKTSGRSDHPPPYC